MSKFDVFMAIIATVAICITIFASWWRCKLTKLRMRVGRAERSNLGGNGSYWEDMTDDDFIDGYLLTHAAKCELEGLHKRAIILREAARRLLERPVTL